ncbi:MAG TPA: DUF885 domain-containing protein [Kribbella sp.]|nr:DUF885 domain-containing protein [Kribbella sp.]
MTADGERPATAIDEIMDRFLDDHAKLDPIMATTFGVTGHDTDLPDLSPDARADVSALRRQTLAALDEAEPADAVDRATVAAAREQLTVSELIRATGAEESWLNNIDSPVQTVRQVFDLMPTSTLEDWEAIGTRLGKVPATIASYIASLSFAAARDTVSPQRQVVAATRQSLANAGADGFFATLAEKASTDRSLPRSLRTYVQHNAQQAADAYQTLATFLGEELFAQASADDPVGEERYALFARHHLGTSPDLAEAYEWGQAELSRISAQRRTTAERIKPGSTVQEAMAHLTEDPARRLSGVAALQAWLQEKADSAVAALAGTHFDIPEPLRTLECRIAPADGGIYYTGPSDDFSRPGRMWWPEPAGVTEFSTWREVSTVYHEGVPGHHLQVGQTVYRRDVLNRWRRLGSWVSGHGEGWGLYAEQLMAELGFLDDPGDLLGMLSSQSFRAVRVVLDVGMHCGLDAPAEVGGGRWTDEKAMSLLRAHTSKSEERLRYELDRYLGLPGQAASYKLGERAWLRLREDVRAIEGDSFDLKDFHRRALDVGSVGLDVLSAAVLGEFDN